uniref:F-box domain-containing protein n=1 Tax=Oryza barthii TaxID=65489 RepID=A0A0D3F085_9ORYZ
MGDDVGAEILLRLPAKAVLRCRAVCRSWRRITTTAYFVAAHSRRRPLQLLGYTGLAVDSSSSPYSYVFTVITSVIPAFCDGDDAGRRILLRRDMRVSLRGSCDGLLLGTRAAAATAACSSATRRRGSWSICRRWKRLRPSAFYFHRPSGEHRVLCYRNGDNYILSTGSGASEPRRLGPVPDHQRRVCSHFCVKVGVTVGDTVYWGRRQTDDRGQMSAFDTVSETFRRVAPPPPPVSHADEGPMFDMHGALAVTAMSSTEPYMDVWIAAAAGGENWVRLLRVELPPGHYYSGEVKPHGYGKAVLDDAGVLLVAMNGCPSFLYDTKGKRMVTGELLSSYQRFYLPELTLLLLTTLSQKYHHR